MIFPQLPVPHFQLPENEILEIPYDKYLTYDAEAMYAYDIGSQTEIPAS